MPKRLTVIIVALGIFVLFVGLMFPTLITASNEPAVTGLQVDETETETVTGGLEATAVETSNADASIRLTDTETQESVNHTISEGETQTFEFSINGESVDVTLEETTDSYVTLSPIEYSRTYGWGDGAELFIGNIGIIFTVIAFLMFAGILMAVGEL